MEYLSFAEPNQHYVGRLMSATDKRNIVATEDIYDRRGIKLWANGRRIDSALRERLLACKLRKPLELCIRMEDGVKSTDVSREIERIFDEQRTISKLAGERARNTLGLYGRLRISGLPHLQLSTAAVDESNEYRHAITTSVIATLIAMHLRAPESAVESIMMAGLAHDFGKLYVDPALLGGLDDDLGFDQWSQIAAHPHIGALLLSECARLPADIVNAVHEHHERLDGSGYPQGLTVEKISAPGRILMIAEVLATTLLGAESPEARTLLALRVVRKQFEPKVVALLNAIFREHKAAVPQGFDPAALAATANLVVERLKRCDAGASIIEKQTSLPETWRRLAEQTRELCRELLLSLADSGILALLEGQAGDPLDDSTIANELHVVVTELKWRTRALSRHIALTASRWTGGMETFEPLVKELAER